MGTRRAIGGTARGTAARTALACALAAAFTACGPRPDARELEIQLPAEVPAGLRFRWHHVNGADGYRLVFSRMSGAPVCTVYVDQEKSPAFVIQRDSMPRGLAHGWQLELEIRAMRHGVPMAPAGVRPLRTP
jgi:hypothetical protein